MKTIQFPVIVHSIKTLADRSIELKIHTGLEQEGGNAVELFSMAEKQYWAAFAETPLRPEDIEVKDIRTEDSKTPSERLRAVLFVYWKQSGEKGNFNDFYLSQMEKFISKVKDNLLPEGE